MRPTRANGQPAAVVYRYGDLLGVAVLGLRNGGSARISLFGDPAIARLFKIHAETRDDPDIPAWGLRVATSAFQLVAVSTAKGPDFLGLSRSAILVQAHANSGLTAPLRHDLRHA